MCRYAVALANWGEEAVEATLTFDFAALAALGLTGANAATLRMMAPAIEGFQPRGLFAAGASLAMRPKNGGMNQGWLLHLQVSS